MSDDRDAVEEERARLDAASALVREHLERELRQARANLTATQNRCTELLDETRAQRMAAKTFCDSAEWMVAFEKALASLRGKT